MPVEAQITVHVIHDVHPEPSYEQVQHIFEQSKECACDAIVAIGGGSSMDTAKLVALMLTNTVSLKEMIKGVKLHGTRSSYRHDPDYLRHRIRSPPMP